MGEKNLASLPTNVSETETERERQRQTDKQSVGRISQGTEEAPVYRTPDHTHTHTHFIPADST